MRLDGDGESECDMDMDRQSNDKARAGERINLWSKD